MNRHTLGRGSKTALAPVVQRPRRIRIGAGRWLAEPLDDAKRELVDEYRALAVRLATRCYRRCGGDIPFEEMIGEAMLALTYAAGRFDQSRGAAFSTYAARMIWICLGRMAYLWRRNGLSWQPMNCDGPDHKLSRRVALRSHPPSRDREAPDNLANRELIENVMATLPDSWRRILEMHLMQGMTQLEIARHLKISRGAIRQAIHQAKKRLRETFPDLCE
jgi:RNA polymerase sigma factor (sigma-70 family)